MIKVVLAAVLSATFALSACAQDVKQMAHQYPLKNGSTLYIFKDGKMAMEDEKGHIVRMKAGEVMETKDGQKLLMVGDEVYRLESKYHRYSPR